MKVTFQHRKLAFKRPSGTSRGILKTKDTYFVLIQEEDRIGKGECSPLSGLSIDDRPEYNDMLEQISKNPALYLEDLAGTLKEWPSIRFGLEMAHRDLETNDDHCYYENEFFQGSKSIDINGLIWMGEVSYMKEQIKNLLGRGFSCLKMKIAAIPFDEEVNILKSIRKEFSASDLILRVDANGGFRNEEALEKLNILSELVIHSIEQPIRQGQWNEMANLCEKSPIPIALDEELITMIDHGERKEMLRTIQPQYIILKPSLVGGFQSSEEWISIADDHQIGWWITSALESNVGLNAISQWTAEIGAKGYQGLGTGSLFTNNVASPLTLDGERLFYNPKSSWDAIF